MIYMFPHYCKEFHCIASDCSDTCCAGWNISIDQASLKKYRTIKSPFGNCLRNSIDWKKSVFRQYHRRCAFLNEENLCDIYLEAGPKLLCHTCRTYPRHREEYKGRYEVSLSLSCIEAARIILSCQEPVRFISKEKPDIRETYPGFDTGLFTALTMTRTAMFGMLQNRHVNFQLRLAMVSALAHDVQTRIDRRRLDGLDELLKRYQSETASKRFADRFSQNGHEPLKRCEIRKRLFGILFRMETSRERWTARLEKMEQSLYGQGAEAYERNNRRFHQSMKKKNGDADTWLIWCEQLVVYFVFTYFCGAVYDGKAYSKIKVALVSTLLIQEMAQAQWQEAGETLEFEDFADIAHCYSRELEHSDRNLELLEKIKIN